MIWFGPTNCIIIYTIIFTIIIIISLTFSPFLWCEEKYMTMAPLWCEAVSTKNGDNFRELSPRLWRLLHTSKIKIFYFQTDLWFNKNQCCYNPEKRWKKLKPSENFWDFLIHHFCFPSVETSWSGKSECLTQNPCKRNAFKQLIIMGEL